MTKFIRLDPLLRAELASWVAGHPAGFLDESVVDQLQRHIANPG